MPITRGDIPNLLTAGLRTEFFNALKSVSEPDYKIIASIFPSSKAIETYAWLGDMPQMNEFISERKLNELREMAYQIVNKKWESTISVDSDVIDDDQYGQVLARIRSLAPEVIRHKNELCFATLGGGFTTKCYDGQYFFSATHSEGKSGTQSNYGTTALSHAAVMSTRAIMRKFKSDTGKYLRIEPNVLVCSSDEEEVALEIVNNEFLPYTESNMNDRRRNPLYKKLQVVISNEFVECIANGGGSWALLDTTKSVKPIILQERKGIEFGMLGKDSETGFMRDEYIYGIKARYGAGVGLWQCAYGHKVA